MISLESNHWTPCRSRNVVEGPMKCSMKYCDTCGAELNEAEPFAVCPKCLLASALVAQRGDRVSTLPTAQANSERPAALLRLFPRPDFFERYEILVRVARGGQGDIWKVWDLQLRRCLAMKRLGQESLASTAAVYRFLAEAQIASQLEHPGILPILDVGLDPDERPFYTTPLLPGTTLHDIWLRIHDQAEAEWTLNRALELLVRVCDVMAHAHSRGVIHRDLKPANVLVGCFGEVRVIDWGSAHVLMEARHNFPEPFVPLDQRVIETDRGEAMRGEPASPLATVTAGQPITVLFMPPEILRGQLAEIGPQTDVYSVGVMLYELLAGYSPYADANGSLPNPSELRRKILQEPPTPLRTLKRAISRDLAAICHKAMARTKADRYASTQALGDDLRAVLEVRPVQARKAGPLLRLQKWAQRNLAPVSLAAVTVLIVVAAVSVARGLKTERDLARQLTALRSAELAARSGQWREALRHWGQAEAADYSDAIDLGLRRAEAWTVLSAPKLAWAELDKLAARSDLGDQRGVVLLRIGEHELFGRTTFERGVEHVREALAAGLTAADQAFAKGLLAQSTPEALDLLRQTLQLDPYHHAAHRHSLGLEFLLGRRGELAAHLRVFKVLYPDDPMPGFIEVAELALCGRLPEAERRLSGLRTLASAELKQHLMSSFRMLAAEVEQYNVQTLLEERPPGPAKRAPAGTDLTVLPLRLTLPSAVDVEPTVRLPQTPCMKRYLEGWNAVRSLALPLFANPEPALQKIKSSWQSHPEALLPTFGATLLNSWQPTEGPKSLPLLAQQAELFQLAADSPSIVPQLQKWARFHAAQAHFELAQSQPTNFPAARHVCLDNLRRAALVEPSVAECRAYFEMAFALGDFELARSLLGQWERHQPGDRRALRARIRLESAAGAFGLALKGIDQLLAEEPGDVWALKQRQFVLEKLRDLLNTTSLLGKPNLEQRIQP